MVAGDRAVADPRRFADALSLETAAQQDGQEFLELLLAYLDAVAARKAGRETDANAESAGAGKLAPGSSEAPSPSPSAGGTRTSRRAVGADARPRRPRARWTSTRWS